MARPIRSPLGAARRLHLHMPAALVEVLRAEARDASEPGASVSVGALLEECVRVARPDLYDRAKGS